MYLCVCMWTACIRYPLRSGIVLEIFWKCHLHSPVSLESTWLRLDIRFSSVRVRNSEHEVSVERDREIHLWLVVLLGLGRESVRLQSLYVFLLQLSCTPETTPCDKACVLPCSSQVASTSHVDDCFLYTELHCFLTRLQKQRASTFATFICSWAYRDGVWMGLKSELLTIA